MIKTILEKLKAWAISTALPEFKKHWMQYVNIFILLLVFAATDGILHVIVGGWSAVYTIYYVLWRFLGLDKLFGKPINPQV